MKIIESDSYIEYKDKCYHVYLMKNKKEVKEDDTDLYKIGGYFITLDSAFKRIIRFRKDKKYKFKENYKLIIPVFIKYLKSKNRLNKLLNSINNPIKKLQSKLFIYEKNKINYWK